MLRAVALLWCVLLMACGRGVPAPSTQARTGPRIISTAPVATTILCELGAADLLVGVSRYDLPVLPAERQDLPVVGDYERINHELLLKLKPTTLVVQVGPARLDPRLQELTRDNGIELVNLRIDRLDDIWPAAETLGRIARRADEAGRQIKLLRGELAEVAQRIAARAKSKPRVLYVFRDEPVGVAGAGTFLGELVTAAGGINVGDEVGKGWPTINRELCVKLKPDVVLLGKPGAPPVQTDDPRIAPWLNLDIPAAASKRIYVLTDVLGQQPSLHVGQIVRDMAQRLHPGLLADDPFGPASAASRPAP